MRVRYEYVVEQVEALLGKAELTLVSKFRLTAEKYANTVHFLRQAPRNIDRLCFGFCLIASLEFLKLIQ